MRQELLQPHIRVRTHFHRSVHVAQDWSEPSNVKNYHVTPTARDLVGRIVNELFEPAGSRAWSISGPFGSGKSSFAVFLADSLCRHEPVHPESRRILQSVSDPVPRLLPVLLVGKRTPLRPALRFALEESCRRVGVWLPSDSRGSGDGLAVVGELYEQAVRLVREKTRFDGLMLVIDELGKFLEHASLHPESDDVFVLQQLAESAARSPGSFVVLTILHSAFTDYLGPANRVQLAEWQKIQGRFTDVAFHLPMEQMLALTATALETTWPDDLSAAYETLMQRVWNSPTFGEVRQRLSTSTLLLNCAPLHPITAVILWPLFRSKLAQNERSLFAFLSNGEPHSLQDFVRKAVWASHSPPIYRLSDLYDYVSTALGPSVVVGDRARRWALIQDALDRLPATAPPVAADVVKSIGLLNLYGRAVGLRAGKEVLELAVGVDSLDGVLEDLEKGSIVLYRRYEAGYALWEGSDVDLDASLEQALRYVEAGSIAQRLQSVVTLRPWVARSHYVQTGTLRYFSVSVIDGVPEALTAARLGEPDDGADGRVVFVLTRSYGQREAIMEEAARYSRIVPTDHVVVFAFPLPITGLEDSVKELAAWTWVRDNVAALQGDSVARQEVLAQVARARETLGQIAGRVLGLVGYPVDPSCSTWMYRREVQPPRSRREFFRWLSELCDETYDGAPVLLNELLNRQQLSSSAAAARRNLLQAMLEQETSERLGFEGSPAEATMYESMLKVGGFHQPGQRGWHFAAPTHPKWTPVWEAIQDFLDSTVHGPRPIQELIDRLRRPPFGMRSGPIPVLLLATLLALRHELALYEEGVYLPELRIEAIERLVRRPENFSVRRFSLTREAHDVLVALRGHMAGTSDSGGITAALVDVARSLLAYVGRLSPFARQTRRFDDPKVVLVREVLLRTRDPYLLIFEELPKALNIRLDTPDAAEGFYQRLQQVLTALEHAHDHLLNLVQDSVGTAFGLTGEGDRIIGQLCKLAAGLDSHATDKRLALFIREISRTSADMWRDNLARVVLDGVPPSHWRDSDVVTFQARIQILAHDFLRLQELVTASRVAGGLPVVRVEFLNGTLEEVRQLVVIPPAEESTVANLVDRFNAQLSTLGSGQHGKQLRLVALARALIRELKSQ